MKKIATDNSRPAVLARIAELEKAGRFDEHTDPVDMSIAMPVTPDFPYVRTAFREYIGVGAKAYVERRKMTSEQVIANIRDAGGVPVLAHPMQYHYPEPELIELIETAKALGIRALEAYYSEFSAEQTAWLLRAAEKYGMGVSGGSDYHGTRKTHISMGTGCGNLAIPYSVLEELKKLR